MGSSRSVGGFEGFRGALKPIGGKFVQPGSLMAGGSDGALMPILQHSGGSNPPCAGPGTVVWGPTAFPETDTTVLGGLQLVKVIAVPFSTLPVGTMTIVFLAGQCRYDNGEAAGSSVVIAVSASPVAGVGDTQIWNTEFGPNAGFPPDWVDVLDVVNGTGPIGFPWPISSFTNPNPSGTGYVKLYANAGSGTPGFESGFRTYTFEIQCS